ncbi:MAG: type II toxin-antitoxin system RelB/DinJ family antitoxin [Eubacteriales bacterium]|nr:type II toxin-antitoxin system RelB/DinJ family antitoxin [Eubacteriales bacterium]
MDNMSMVQARTPEKLKANASEVLDQLGLNLSTYINMALNQLVIQRRIPFEVGLDARHYTDREAVDEVTATMRMEGFELKQEEIDMLKACRKGNISSEELRRKFIAEA